MTFVRLQRFLAIWFSLAVMMFGVSACTGIGRVYPTDVFIPPTRMPTLPQPTPNPTIPIIAPMPSATPATFCTPGLTFIKDVTLPDGVQVRPGEMLDKRWQVRNSGDCNWDAGYRLKLAAGPGMDAAEEQKLYPARGGSEATIRIQFTAPVEAGEYRSAWQAYRPDGQPFGDPIYIVIIVP